jgi:hypothetical protein
VNWKALPAPAINASDIRDGRVITQDLTLVGGEDSPADLLPDLGEDGLLDSDLPGQPIQAEADQPFSLAADDHVDGGGQRNPILEVEGAAAAFLREHADDAVTVAPGPRPDFPVLIGDRCARLDLPAGADPWVADQPHRRPPSVHSALGRSYSPGETGFRPP